MSYAEAMADRFRSLADVEVLTWHGIEMSLRDAGPDGAPVFADEQCAHLQFHTLRLEAVGASLEIATYQNDVRWGLCINPTQAELVARSEGVFRYRSVPELPRGLLLGVQPEFDEDGELARVRLNFGSEVVELVAGEVYEQPDGSLRIQVGGDESVLVRVESLSNYALERTDGTGFDVF